MERISKQANRLPGATPSRPVTFLYTVMHNRVWQSTSQKGSQHFCPLHVSNQMDANGNKLGWCTPTRSPPAGFIYCSPKRIHDNCPSNHGLRMPQKKTSASILALIPNRPGTQGASFPKLPQAVEGGRRAGSAGCARLRHLVPKAPDRGTSDQRRDPKPYLPGVVCSLPTKQTLSQVYNGCIWYLMSCILSCLGGKFMLNNCNQLHMILTETLAKGFVSGQLPGWPSDSSLLHVGQFIQPNIQGHKSKEQHTFCIFVCSCVFSFPIQLSIYH